MLISKYDLRAFFCSKAEHLVIFFCFSLIYIGLAWIVSGGERWWVADFVHGSNVFYGDDAYRFFLAKSMWQDTSLFTYNFNLPAALFLENTVVSMTGGELFLSRCVHGVIAAISVSLAWDSGRMLGIGRGVMTGAVLVMGLMPLYAFVSLSFYGEFWLGALVSIAIWLFLRKSWMALSFIVAIFPLTRAEGIYFWAPIFLFMLKEKRWKEGVVMIMPGSIYFIYLYCSLPSIGDFFYWRIELREILKKIDYKDGIWSVPGTFSVLLTLPAILGGVFSLSRKLWLFIVGAGLAFLILVISTYRNLTFYEPRYIYFIIPVLILMWAGFFDWLSRARIKGAGFGYIMIVIVLVGSNLGSLTVVKAAIQSKGLGWVLERVVRWDWGGIFPSYLPEHMESYQSMSRRIENVLANDESIDRLVMFDSFLYYFINPDAIPSRVRVDYPAAGYLVFHVMLNGQIFTQHPGGSMYSYIRFGKPEYLREEKRALYADLMPMPNCPYRWEQGPVQLYLFSYKESLHPEVDLGEVPTVDPDRIKDMYERIFGH